ncbi:MAG TPA: hypothetical protein VJZ71_04070 [Phycisphaerae bacterium]|nr:hypothetical protein [Phycisphaerae bacterium]
MIAAGIGTGSRFQKIFGGIIMIGSPCVAIALMVVEGRRNKRESMPPGHCHSCGYNLTGNVSGRCPECGTPVSL